MGEWTPAETVQRAFGDADALSVGDFHLAKMVGWSLLGHPIDDPQMVELLEPMRRHRHRAVGLVEVSGLAVNPRFGPRAHTKSGRYVTRPREDVRAVRGRLSPPGGPAPERHGLVCGDRHKKTALLNL